MLLILIILFPDYSIAFAKKKKRWTQQPFEDVENSIKYKLTDLRNKYQDRIAQLGRWCRKI